MKKNSLILILNLLSFFFTYLVIINYLKFDVLDGHCVDYVFENLSDLLYCGRVLSGVTNFFFYTILPNLTGINPNDLQNTYIAYTKGLVILANTFLITKLFYTFYKDKKISLFRDKAFFIIFLIIFCFIFNDYGIKKMYSFTFLSDSAIFFDYCLSSVFFLIFLNFIIRVLNNNGKSNKIYLILNYIAIFLLGISQDYFLLLGFIIQTYIIFLQILSTKIKFLKPIKIDKEAMKTIIFSYISLIIGIAVFLHFSNYTTLQNVGGGHDIDWIEQFNTLNIKLIPFLKEYWEYGLLPYIPIFIGIALPFFKKKYTKEKLIISITLLSVLTIDPLFLLIGECEFGTFYISYHSIIFCRLFIFIILFFASLGLIFRLQKDQNKVQLLLVLNLLILSFLTYDMCNNIKNHYINAIEVSKEKRKDYIICDKIAQAIGYNTEIIILPISVYNSMFTQIPFYREKDVKEKAYLEKIIEEEKKQKLSRIFVQDKDFSVDDEKEFSNMFFPYIWNVYKFSPKLIIYCDESKLKKLYEPFFDIEKINIKKFGKIEQKKSIDEINRLIEIYPDNFLVYLYRAKIYKDEKKYDEAFKDYTEAIIKDNGLKLPYYLRGILHRELGNYNLAIKDLEIVAKEYPNSILLKYNLAKLMTLNKDYHKAIKIYTELIDIYPYSINSQLKDFYYYRGLIYKEHLKDYNSALKDFLKSKEINYLANFVQINENIGDCYLKLKNINNAINYYEYELGYNDNNPDLYFKKAELYYKKGDIEQSVEDFETYIEFYNTRDEISNTQIKKLKKYINDIEKEYNDEYDTDKIDEFLYEPLE